MMHGSAALFACLFYSAHASRLLASQKRSHRDTQSPTHQSDEMNSLTRLLLGCDTAAAFNPTSTSTGLSAVLRAYGSRPAVGHSPLRYHALPVMSSEEETPVLESPKVSAPAGFAPPEPQPLTVTGDIGGVLSGSAGLVFRAAAGVFVQGWSPFNDQKADDKYSLSVGPLTIRDDSMMIRGECARPTEPLVLYEYEASPFCRKVRDAMAILDLTVVYKPCPGARAGFSDELFERTGRRTVPYFIDPNTGKEMFESDDIINYLFNTYGPGEDQVPGILKGGAALWSCTFAALARGMAGAQRQPNARPDNEQMKPIEIWGYEASPFVKPVREKLCSLALPHKMVNAARGSANRDVLFAKTGRFQVPFISDPNTGVEMFESIEIVKYLDEVYTSR